MRVGEREIRRGASFFSWALALFICASLVLGGRGIQAATVQYVYDELGRLTAVIDPSADVTEYAYDEVGNILSVSRRSASQVSIISFTPGRGLVGQAVTIIGTAFSPVPAQNQVTFNGTAAIVTAATATSLVATVPLGATTGPISVTTPAGTATSSGAFSLREAPLIASFTPATGEPGGTLSIAGRGFTEPGLSVIVNKAPAQVLSTTLSSFTGRIPSATGGKITVTNELGSATSTDDFFIVPPPRTAADVAATGRIAIDGPGQALALPAGKVGLLLFDGTAGGSGVRIALSGVTLAIGTLSVLKPDGTPLATPVAFGTDGASFALTSLPVTGTYGVLVAADAAASGNVTVAATTVAVANSLAIGDTIVPSLAAGQIAQFTFQGQVGQNLGIDLSNVAFASAPFVSVLNPSGTTVASATVIAGTGIGLRIPTLAVAGTYTIRIQPPNSAGSLQLTLWSDITGTLTIGTTETVRIAFRNQFVRKTFTGTTGQNLGVDVASTGFMANAFVIVTDPNGATVASATVPPATANLALRLPTLSVGGNNTVTLQPPVNTTGSFQLTVWSDVTGSVIVDQPATVTLLFRNQFARETFTGTAGQNLGVDIASVSSPGYMANAFVVVTDPNGATVASATVPPATASLALRLPTLTVSGTYRVTVQPPVNTTGSFQLTVWSDVIGSVIVDQPATVTLPFRNQFARETFTGTAGQNLGVDIASVSSPGYMANAFVIVTDPNGATVASATVPPTASLALRLPTLTVSGTYRVTVQGPVNTTGSFQLTVWSDVTGSVIVDQPATVTLPFRNQFARKTFTGTAGQNLGVDIASVSSPGYMANAFVIVTDPNGATVASATVPPTASLALRLPTLTVSGTYRVTVQGPVNTTGSFQLTVWSDVTGSVIVDQPATVTLPFRNQFARKTFTGTAGQNLGVDIAPVAFMANAFVVVTDPNGATVASATVPPATASLALRLPTLTVSGTYRVTVQPLATVSGTLQLTVWSDVTNVLTVGTPLPTTITFRNQQARLPFNGTTGQTLRVSLTSVTLPAGSSLIVLQPSGSSIVNTTFGSAGVTVDIPALTATGVYIVQIIPGFIPGGGGTGSAVVNLTTR